MKKIITIFFVCLIILGYISCEKEKSNPLEGTWKYVRPEINNEFMQIPSEEITNTFYGSKMKTNNSLGIDITYDIDITKDSIITELNGEKIFNVWNEESVSIKEWIKLCYEVVGKDVIFKNVNEEIEQRNYFSFYNYEYKLDITSQRNLLKETTNLREGLRESYCWYKNNKDKVNRKAYLDFINKNFE